MRQELLLTSLTSLSGRYAKAFFETSKKQSEQREILKNFEEISSLLKENRELERALLSRILNKKQLDIVLVEVGKKIKFMPLFLNFIRLLANERRLLLLYSIYEKYQMLSDFCNNDRKLTVFSASPLMAKEKINLQKKLSGLFSGKIEMTFAIDESILSGIVVKADTFILDASYRTQLKHLTEILKG
ncbi:MAG: ATP synthase F1 subunit delta [Alphaproteobacteria bacterium]|nr:ATP synthase F1 subunit delta [Alphaproteobacteria bacterium]